MIIGNGSHGISPEAWNKFQDYYENGGAYSSEWLRSFNINDKTMSNNMRHMDIKRELEYALVTCANSVNIVRPTFGFGKNKNLNVGWYNTLNSIVDLPFSVISKESKNPEKLCTIFLDPAPIKLSSNYTCHQRYDAVIGDGLIQSVQKNSIDVISYEFFVAMRREGGSVYVNGKEVTLKNSKNKEIYSFSVENEFMFPFQGMGVKDKRIGKKNLKFIKALWTAVELIAAEKYLVKNYVGAGPYVYAHRSFYKCKDYIKKLSNYSQQIKIERDILAFINLIYSILNPTDKFSRHKFYSKFVNIIINLFNFDYKATSSERLYSVICCVMVGCYMLNKPGKWLKNKSSDNGIYNPFDSDISKEEYGEMVSDLKEKFEDYDISDGVNKLLSELKKNGMMFFDPSQNSDCVREHHTQNSDCVREQHTMQSIDVGSSKQMAKEIFYQDLFNKMKFEEKFFSSNDVIEYKNCIKKNSAIIDNIQENIKVISMMPRNPECGMKSGQIDEACLYKLVDFNEEEIFYQDNIDKKLDCAAITIIMDQSESMSENNRVDLVKTCSIILSEALKGIHNLKLRFFGFSSNVIYNYNIDNDFYSLGSIRNSGGTSEGEAIAEIISLISHEKEQKNEEDFNQYIFVLGDGEVDITSSMMAFSFAKSCGFNIYHFGLDNAYSIEYGEKVYGKGKFALLPTKNLLHAFTSILCQLLLH
jgi:hypothetical protein